MMVIGCPNNNRSDIRETGVVNVVTHFTYIGSEDNNGGCEREMNRKSANDEEHHAKIEQDMA